MVTESVQRRRSSHSHCGRTSMDPAEISPTRRRISQETRCSTMSPFPSVMAIRPAPDLPSASQSSGAQRPVIQHWSEQSDPTLLTVFNLQIGHRHHSCFRGVQDKSGMISTEQWSPAPRIVVSMENIRFSMHREPEGHDEVQSSSLLDQMNTFFTWSESNGRES